MPFSFILAAALVAGVATPPSDPAGGQPAPSSERVRYCVSTDALNGSHVERRVCRTRATWLEMGIDPLALR